MEELNERIIFLENGDCFILLLMFLIIEMRFKVYKWRWYVLFVFIVNVYVYNMVWNIWVFI